MRTARDAVGASAVSIFVLDESTRCLQGAHAWDWTRTSFPCELEDWPNVASALADGAPRVISRDDARGAETGWFESRGIARTVCLPVREHDGSAGVVFFDFDAPSAVNDDAALLADVSRHAAVAMRAG